MTLSFIMQTYLGDYPGARSNPIEKFHRMVKCFLKQTNPNWELIIVSDGCDITMDEYEKYYIDNPKIKFAYVTKPKDTLMYAESTGEKYFRGQPRQIGLEIATGDWVGYVDSDDFILINAVENLIEAIKKTQQSGYPGPPVKAISNQATIKNVMYADFTAKAREKGLVDVPVSNPITIPGLGGEWQVFKFEDTKLSLGTVSIFHERTWPKHKWIDSIGNCSEDMLFVKPFTINPLAQNTDTMAIPYYVVCHYSKKWDY